MEEKTRTKEKKEMTTKYLARDLNAGARRLASDKHGSDTSESARGRTKAGGRKPGSSTKPSSTNEATSTALIAASPAGDQSSCSAVALIIATLPTRTTTTPRKVEMRID